MDMCNFQTVLINGKIAIETYSQGLVLWKEDLIIKKSYFLFNKLSKIQHYI